MPRKSAENIVRALILATSGVCLYVVPASRAQSTGDRLPGLDVSDWQGTINWSQVAGAGGKKFAFIRSSRGGTTGFYDENDSGNTKGKNTLSQRYDDYKFVENVTNSVANGLLVGPYHFARPDIISTTKNANGIANTGVDEANHFLQQAQNWMRPGYLLPVLDFEAGQSERSSSALTQFAMDFANRIKSVVGAYPIVYASQSYANYGGSQLTVMPLWIARWNGQGTSGYDWSQVPWNTGNPAPSPSTANVYGKWNPNYPTIPNSQPWPGEQPWSFWQYTSVGRVPGIGNGNVSVDLDAVHGTIEYLRDFLVPALWTANGNGDWSNIANWNSNNPGYVAGNNATGPAPRLPGPIDTIILNNALSANSYAVTLSNGSHEIRKLYVQQPLNMTGGSLTVNYIPAADSTPISAQFSQNVALSNIAAFSVHTLVVDAARTFTLSGGSFTLNTLTLSAGATPAKLLVNGNVTLNPLNNAFATITSSSNFQSATLDLGGGTRTLTVGDGSASVDLTINLPIVSGSITKAGAGTLQINRSATLNSIVAVNGGTLIATQVNQLGTGVTTAPGGSLFLAGSLAYNTPLTIGGAGAMGVAGAAGVPSSPGNPGAIHASSGNSTWSGPLTLVGTGANGTDALINQVSAAAGATLTLSGAISSPGTGALAKSGAGDLVLAGPAANTYPGLTRLYGGRIIVEKDAAFGSAAAHTFILADSPTTVAFRSASSLTYSTQEYIHTEGPGAPGFAQVDNLAGNNTFAGSIAIAGPANTGSIGVTAGSLTISGGLYSRSGASSRAINKTGSGTLTLTGDSSLVPMSSLAVALVDSTMNVTAGTLDLRSPDPDAPNVRGLATFNVSPGATLQNSAGTLIGASLVINGAFTQQSAARLYSVSLTLNPGAAAVFAPSDASPSLLSTLNLIGSATLDLTSNDLLISTVTPSVLREYLSNHRLFSSVADADPLHLMALGYADVSDVTHVSVTCYGDANLNGTIDADDYALLDRGNARHLSTWQDGDFNYDGMIDDQDYMLIDTVFARQAAALSPEFLSTRESQFGPEYVETLLASVPEPSLLAACGLAGIMLGRRGRRK